jgi:hypothetical protein
VVTVTVTTSLTQQSGTLTIPITADGQTFTKIFVWSVSRTGTTGATGNTGATGISITAVTPYFQTVSTGAAAPAKPTASPPPAPWTATEPNYTAGTELYRTERVDFSNATFAYTDVSKVSSYAAAVTAINSANGKNKIIFSTSAASGTAYVDGDVWFQKSGTNIIGQWEFVAGAWASRTLRNEVIASLDAGKLTAGSAFTNALSVKSTFTLGDASVDGVIQSFGYSPTTAGIALSKNGLVVRGSGGVATLTITASTGSISMIGNLQVGSTFQTATITADSSKVLVSAGTGGNGGYVVLDGNGKSGSTYLHPLIRLLSGWNGTPAPSWGTTYGIAANLGRFNTDMWNELNGTFKVQVVGTANAAGNTYQYPATGNAIFPSGLTLGAILEMSGNNITMGGGQINSVAQVNNGSSEMQINMGTLLVKGTNFDGPGKAKFSGAANFVGFKIGTDPVTAGNGSSIGVSNGGWVAALIDNMNAANPTAGNTRPFWANTINGFAAYNNASDAREKTEIEDVSVDHALAVVRGARVRSFKMPRLADHGDRRQYGVIAQEVREVFPSMIFDMVPSDDPEEHRLGASYQDLWAMGLVVIQDLLTRIEMLESRL